MPYITSEFDAAAEGINFPYLFGVGNESEPNDFPGQYRNGPVIGRRDLDCFVRYFVSTVVRKRTCKHHAHASRIAYSTYKHSLHVSAPFRPCLPGAGGTQFLTDSMTSSNPQDMPL